MSAWNAYLKLDTPKLHVPTELKPTRPNDRTWLVPFFGKNPIWSIPLAIVPALIATILIFMDQQITAVIINRKEFKLKVNEKKIVTESLSFIFLEKTWLSSGFTCSRHFNLNSIITWSTMVCGSYCFSINTY